MSNGRSRRARGSYQENMQSGIQSRSERRKVQAEKIAAMREEKKRRREKLQAERQERMKNRGPGPQFGGIFGKLFNKRGKNPD